MPDKDDMIDYLAKKGYSPLQLSRLRDDAVYEFYKKEQREDRKERDRCFYQLIAC